MTHTPRLLAFGIDLSSTPDITTHYVYEKGKAPTPVEPADITSGKVSQSGGIGGSKVK